MEKFKRFVDIDYSQFEGDDLEALYGLPKKYSFVKVRNIKSKTEFCEEYKNGKKSTKETIHFDDAGVCDACRMAEQKQKIDWEEREKELIEVCNKYRSTDGSYDCLVPGSGGKDSFIRHTF